MKQKITCETTVNHEGHSLKIDSVYMTSAETLLVCFTLTEPPAGAYPRKITTLKDEIEIDTGINEKLPVTLVTSADARLTDTHLICLYRATTTSIRDENGSRRFFSQQSHLINEIEKTRLEVESTKQRYAKATTRLEKLESQYRNNALFAVKNSIWADEKEEQEQAIWDALVRLGVTKRW